MTQPICTPENLHGRASIGFFPMADVVECVPNVSEGRNQDVIDRIVAAAARHEGIVVLGVEPDADYNRTVITFAGPANLVELAAVDLSIEAIRSIDMRQHSGEHPRLGAVDVCPFVPIRGIDMEACAAIAERVAKAVHDQTGAPTFLYGAAAREPGRKKLSDLRRGEYEGLQKRLEGGEDRMPDFGSERGWSDEAASAGGCTFGARPVLVAYNVNVPEPEAVVAKHIGSIVRGSGRIVARTDQERVRVPGMLESVQGMGVMLESHGISQVSMNLTDVETHGLLEAFETVRSLAADHGLEVTGSELVGLVPLAPMLRAGRFYSPDLESEADLVEAAVNGLGLDALGLFDPSVRIIEWAIQEAVQ